MHSRPDQHPSIENKKLIHTSFNGHIQDCINNGMIFEWLSIVWVCVCVLSGGCVVCVCVCVCVCVGVLLQPDQLEPLLKAWQPWCNRIQYR